MEQKIMEILQQLHPEMDISADVCLVDDGVLDSLDIVTLVTELNAAFDIAIPAVEILPTNFNSVGALVAMIERLEDV